MFKSFNEIRQTRRAVVRAELIGSDRATAAGITARSYTPILALCRLLVAAGFDPNHALIAYRRGTLAVRVRSIGEAAKLELNSKGTAFVRRVQAVRTAPPITPKPPTP